jgi:hypothetical protein
MNKKTITLSKFLIIVVGIFVLIFMLWEPHLEGRNIDSTIFEVYFKDPFLAYVYTASIAFFVALYQAYRLIVNVDKNRVVSIDSMNSLRIIKKSGRVLLVFVLGVMGYLIIIRPEEDITGGIFMSLLAIVVSGAISIVASKYEKTLKRIMRV